jgi:hypothetical protein
MPDVYSRRLRMVTKTKNEIRMSTQTLRKSTGELTSPSFSTKLSEKIVFSDNAKKIGGKFYTGYNSCDHIKIRPSAYQEHWTSSDRAYVYKDWVTSHYASPLNEALAVGKSQAHIALDFQKDNQFDFVSFIAEWDETLAMFTADFLRKLKWSDANYGAWTWGLTPIYSDIESLLNTLEAIRGKLVASYEKILGKRYTQRTSWEWNKELAYYEYNCSAKGITVVSGHLTGNVFPDTPIKALSVLMDELGMNFDVRALWDIIPLSFVVDYFLPIGDYLESLHPRGWFKPEFVVSGCMSTKFLLKMEPVKRRQGSNFFVERYWRSGGGPITVPSRPAVVPDWSCPSLRQLFNSAYILRRL